MKGLRLRDNRAEEQRRIMIPFYHQRGRAGDEDLITGTMAPKGGVMVQG